MKQQGAIRSARIKASLGAALAVAGIAIAATPVMGADAPAGQMSSADLAAAVTALAGQFRAEIQRLPSDSSVEAFEAAILFIADQSGQPENVICGASDVVSAEAATPGNAKVALKNVCRQTKNRRGTGAIGNSGGQFGGSNFSSPVISTGGGSSNYAQ